jgi:3-oxoacyl-[acyl-carrier protein] reductase
VNGLHDAELVAELRELGGTAQPFVADVTDEQQAAQPVSAVAARLGPVDVLVLNATGPQPEAPAEAVT